MTPPTTLFAALIGSTAAAAPDRPAFEDGRGRLCYGDLRAHVLATSQALIELGVRAGDRVIIALPNSAELPIAVLAAASLGAIAAPVPAGLTAERLRALVEIAGARAGIFPMDVARPSLPGFSFALDRAAGRPVFADRSSPAASPATVRPPAPDDPALILFSSGSTGRPKGVVLDHRHLLATARNLSTVFGLGPDHRELIICPLCHSDGWQRCAATWLAGGCVVPSEGMLSVHGLLEDVARLGITGFFTPPPLVRLLFRLGPERLRVGLATCRSIELGSAPLAASELDQLCALVPEAQVFFHYGLTECSRAVILDARAHPDKRGTVGRPAPGVELAIVGENRRRLATGQSGEIYLRGPQLARGYWGEPALDRERFCDGWLATGDHGVLDGDGFLTLLGRRDDLITCGGHHYFPAEVEWQLGPQDGVVDYLVAGVPDPQGLLEQVPWAFVVPRDPRDWTPQAFLREARRRLPSHMIPRQVVAVRALATGPSGKPDRRRTAQLHGPETLHA